MNIEKLMLSAKNAINNTPKPFQPAITINMPGKWGKKNEVKLYGKNSPTGTIVQSFEGGITVHFNAIDVLAYCAAALQQKATQ